VGFVGSVAIRSVPSVQSGDTVVLSQGDIYEGSFIVEAAKPTQTQDGCSASVIYSSFYPNYGEVNHEFPQSNSETRLELSSKQYCNCRYQLLSDGIRRVSCTCRVSDVKIGRRAYFDMEVKICDVSFAVEWVVEGNY
jgi:hypothetical protein